MDTRAEAENAANLAAMEALPEALEQAKKGKPRLFVAILSYLMPRPAVIYVEKPQPPIILSGSARRVLPKPEELRGVGGARRAPRGSSSASR